MTIVALPIAIVTSYVLYQRCEYLPQRASVLHLLITTYSGAG